ncbi:MAG: LamG domain-containing protein [Candidatus Marsarchaeota archaeon]|nr:LamG domain-containing protein [Candidatus Marsarchaeota archaeon]
MLFNSCFGPVTFFRNSNNIQAGTGICLPNSDIGQWLFFAGTYNGSSVNAYVNGAWVSNTAISGSMATQASFQLIPDGVPNTYFANLQAYNTSLTANEIQALYLEGIGGAPIKPQNIVGWWPLNGNANDYSGNNNNGVPTNMVYTNQWLSGYTPP